MELDKFNSMHAELKKNLLELSAALKDLHKELLMLEAKNLQASADHRLSPYEILHASLNNPAFAWLRSMSLLIVNIDTVVDETQTLSGKEANQVADAVLGLLEKPLQPPESDFWQKYSGYLSENPDIIMKHSQVKSIIAILRPNM